jgi:hypothetical protein
MKGVLENPRQQQTHSDNHEHWSFQSLPIPASALSRRSAIFNRARDLSALCQVAGEILR